MHVSYIWEVLTQPFCPFRCRGSRPQQPNREMGVVLQEVVHDPNFNYRILKEEGDPPLHVDPIYRIMYPGAVVYKDVCWIFNIITCFCMLLLHSNFELMNILSNQNRCLCFIFEKPSIINTLHISIYICMFWTQWHPPRYPNHDLLV